MEGDLEKALSLAEDVILVLEISKAGGEGRDGSRIPCGWYGIQPLPGEPSRTRKAFILLKVGNCASPATDPRLPRASELKRGGASALPLQVQGEAGDLSVHLTFPHLECRPARCPSHLCFRICDNICVSFARPSGPAVGGTSCHFPVGNALPSAFPVSALPVKMCLMCL